MTTKLRAQVKASFYYYFWGTATAAVVATGGFVATGFHRMAQSIEDTVEVATLLLEVQTVMMEAEILKLEIDYLDEEDPNFIDAFQDTLLLQKR